MSPCIAARVPPFGATANPGNCRSTVRRDAFGTRFGGTKSIAPYGAPTGLVLRFARIVLLAVLLTVTAPAAFAQAAIDATPIEFRDAAEERRFQSLIAELRCVMCQNQSLADSNAQIAHDLRREVFTLMREGRDDREIKAFLVERYGEFVLYRPRFGAHTWLLWLGPAILLSIGALVVVRIVRNRQRLPIDPDEEQEW